MKSIGVLCLLLGVTLGYTIESNPQVADVPFQTWKLTHQKAYKDLDEERVRYAIYQDNLNFVNQHNAQNKHLKMGMNQFGDLTNTEFRYLTINVVSAPCGLLMFSLYFSFVFLSLMQGFWKKASLLTLWMLELID